MKKRLPRKDLRKILALPDSDPETVKTDPAPRVRRICTSKGYAKEYYHKNKEKIKKQRFIGKGWRKPGRPKEPQP